MSSRYGSNVVFSSLNLLLKKTIVFGIVFNRLRIKINLSRGGSDDVGSRAVPPVPVPPEVEAFLARPNPAVVATLRPDGSPHTVPTWYDWEDGRALLNMDESRLRLRCPGRLVDSSWWL